MLTEKTRNPVLVLGGYLSGLWIAREFGKHGIDVYVVASERSNIAFKSRYCKKKITTPEPWTCQILKKILQKTSKITSKRQVVYPTDDINALHLSKVKEEVSDDYYFVVGKREATETLVNKRKFYQALKKADIEYPETFFPQDLTSAKNIGKDMNYPVFIRPAITQLLLKEFGFRKGFVAKSYAELLNYYRLATSKDLEIMFQEIIPGPPHNSYQLEGYFNKKFCSTGLFARQRLRIWPPDFGNTTLCVSLPLSKLTLESKQIPRFIKNIGYNGLASAEYKKDPKDGRNKLLEINARPWTHLWLSSKCGVDILLSSYLDAIGEKITHRKGYAIGIKSIHFYRDLLISMKMVRKGELTFLEWLSSLKGVQQSELFDSNDLFPFFVFYLEKLRMFNNRLLKNLVLNFPRKNRAFEVETV